MAASGTVSAGDTILASQYNNLRIDVLDTSSGHAHTGTDSKLISTLKNDCAYSTARTGYRCYSHASLNRVTENDPLYINTDGADLFPNTSGTTGNGKIGVNDLHDGMVITSFKVFWFRNNASASGTARLNRVSIMGGLQEMAAADSNSSAGNHKVEDTTISHGTVDVATPFSYHIAVAITNVNATNNAVFYCAQIAFTVTYLNP